MATLKEQIQSDLAEAMKAKDDVRKFALRLLTAAVKNAEIEARESFDDGAVLGVVQKQAKQRRESIAEYEKAGRADLVEREQSELIVLEAYLPPQVGREEIEAAARRVISETDASGPRDIGKVMPVLMGEFKGQADGKLVNEVVRGLLGT